MIRVPVIRIARYASQMNLWIVVFARGVVKSICRSKMLLQLKLNLRSRGQSERIDL